VLLLQGCDAVFEFFVFRQLPVMHLHILSGVVAFLLELELVVLFELVL